MPLHTYLDSEHEVHHLRQNAFSLKIFCNVFATYAGYEFKPAEGCW